MKRFIFLLVLCTPQLLFSMKQQDLTQLYEQEKALQKQIMELCPQQSTEEHITYGEMQALQECQAHLKHLEAKLAKIRVEIEYRKALRSCSPNTECPPLDDEELYPDCNLEDICAENQLRLAAELEAAQAISLQTRRERSPSIRSRPCESNATDKKHHKCPHCPKTFTDFKRLQNHADKVHNNRKPPFNHKKNRNAAFWKQQSQLMLSQNPDIPQQSTPKENK